MATPLISAVSAGVNRGKRAVLQDISLEVRPGEVLALVGPNGAGKSTLLAALAGELFPSVGSVEILGQASKSYRPRALARIRSLLLQSNEVSFGFRAHEVVQMGRNPWAGTDAEDRDDEVVSQAMADTGISHLRNRPFNELSGGERARVSLARVLAQDTQLVLLDEPTAALDLHHQDRVMRLVRARATSDRAVVVAVHDLSLAAAYADRVALLANGQLDSVGSVNQVFTEKKLRDVYGVPLHVLSSPEGHPMVVPVRKLS